MSNTQPEPVNELIPFTISLADLIDQRVVPIGGLIADYLIQYKHISLDNPKHIILNSLLRTNTQFTFPEELQVRAIYAYIQTYGGELCSEVLDDLNVIMARKERVAAFLTEYRKSRPELTFPTNLSFNHNCDLAANG